MIAIKTADLTQDFKRIADLIIGGEKVLVSRPHNENLVVITEEEYNKMEKACRNAEYLEKIDRSRQELMEGKTVSFTVEELEEMENMTAAELQAFHQIQKGHQI